MRVLVLVVAMGAAGAVAAEEPVGAIAFAQAPEQSGGVGVAATVEEAIAAAMAECVAGGAPEENCFITAACEPAGGRWTCSCSIRRGRIGTRCIAGCRMR